jgi:hypothetical protein
LVSRTKKNLATRLYWCAEKWGLSNMEQCSDKWY